MQIRYDNDSDVLQITLRDLPPSDVEEHGNGVIVSVGTDRLPVSIEVLHAAERGLIDPQNFSLLVQGALQG